MEVDKPAGPSSDNVLAPDSDEDRVANTGESGGEGFKTVSPRDFILFHGPPG